ncbi:MAG: hypothetical protein AB2735_04700 [Candidatus Thiodiazotropha taylori]
MIVCLGWGSLVWSQGNLVTKGDWQNNGPRISVEYLRQSNNGRLTLVIDNKGVTSQVFWSEMLEKDLELAKEELRKREGNIRRSDVGVWTKGDENPNDIEDLDSWAESIGASAIIWTALPPKFRGENNRRPDINEAISYLESLEREPRALAEEYIRRTPAQIRTPYRIKFEEYFGWT